MSHINSDFLERHGFSPSILERFFCKVLFTDSCWLWLGHIGTDGYGYINRGGKRGGKLHASRASWMLHFGEIPDGIDVLHDCPGGDNKACVNPAHLWLGNDSDNIRDAIQKGLFKPPVLHGESNGRSKLSDLEILQIRQLSKVGFHCGPIANAFDVSRSHVANIIAGRKR